MWILNDAIKPNTKDRRLYRLVSDICLLDHVDRSCARTTSKYFVESFHYAYLETNPLSTTQCGISNYGGLWLKVAANKQKPINYMRRVATREIGWKQKFKKSNKIKVVHKAADAQHIC